MRNIDFDSILSLPQNSHQLISQIDNNPVIIYGAGIVGKQCLKYLEENNIKPVAVCDTFKTGQEFFEYTICDINDVIKSFKNPKIIITPYMYYQEIREKLLKIFNENVLIPYVFQPTEEMIAEYRDFLRENISEHKKLYNTFDDEKSRETFVNILKGKVTGDSNWFSDSYVPNQYFVDDIIKLSENESFVDGGAYTGDTLEVFIDKTNNKFDKIFCFEPNSDMLNNIIKFKKNSNDDRIVPFKAGLYSDNKVLGFYGNNVVTLSSEEVNDKYKDFEMIDVVSIDNVIDDKVTFIKMDIEGSELEALKGAEKTILKYKPKLAICVYHKVEDILDIPNYIMSLGLDYKYYLRHHNPDNLFETVFYAV